MSTMVPAAMAHSTGTIQWVYDVDPEARWVRLEYDWMGRQFAFIVDLTKEAGA